ncbi:hypothetical protein C8J57DRAFT_1236818 [Mycena rebaudengoi]|nr:hypothetical protein C8J57DRAFT_1236818 [Mycena rebaudengoi]
MNQVLSTLYVAFELETRQLQHSSFGCSSWAKEGNNTIRRLVIEALAMLATYMGLHESQIRIKQEVKQVKISVMAERLKAILKASTTRETSDSDLLDMQCKQNASGKDYGATERDGIINKQCISDRQTFGHVRPTLLASPELAESESQGEKK